MNLDMSRIPKLNDSSRKFIPKRKEYDNRPFCGKNPGGSEEERKESLRRNSQNEEPEGLGRQRSNIGSINTTNSR